MNENNRQFRNDLKMENTLQQKLVMTPMLQQALAILQLSTVELLDLIQDELAENPLLEEKTVSEEPEKAKDKDTPEDKAVREKEVREKEEDLAAKPGQDSEAEAPVPEKESDLTGQTEAFDDNWIDYFEDSSDVGYLPPERDEKVYFENALTRLPTLYEHLLWQLRLSTYGEDDFAAGEEIIGNINKDGYLVLSPDDIAAEKKIPIDRVLKVLKIIQGFEPVGVGARDLKECLLIQLQYLGYEGSWPEKIVAYHLEDLEKRKFTLIARKLDIKLAAVKEAARVISTLEPKPGRLYDNQEVKYVIPDVILEKIDGEYVVYLNDSFLPRLRINPYYARMLRDKSAQGSLKGFVSGKYNSAIWLIKSIEQRRRTIYRVAESIVNVQRDFFDKGIKYLKPLTLHDIAETINVHESTVSRVTSNKYLQSPRGIFEMKYFFTSRISSDSGTDASSRSVKEMIKDLILSENHKKPLSDRLIAEILKTRGLNIARRTVTKYREELQILPSSKRKQV